MVEYDPDILENDEDLSWYFEDKCYDLGSFFKQKFGKTMCAKIVGRNLDWRNSSGEKYVNYELLEDDTTKIGRQLLRDITPRNTDYSFNCTKRGNGLFIIVYHHDCPTGSLFTLTPCAVSTWERKNS